jgi:hypothetical protein
MEFYAIRVLNSLKESCFMYNLELESCRNKKQRSHPFESHLLNLTTYFGKKLKKHQQLFFNIFPSWVE